MPGPHRQISDERKAAYYIGQLLTVVGFLLFFSFFFSMCSLISGPHTPFDMQSSSSTAAGGFGRAVVGFILIAVGQGLRTLGARGAAGSGLTLDPEQARQDLEPWNRMAGGMVNDTLSEIEPVQKIVDKLTEAPSSHEPVVKVRCRECHALNDEGARFCNQCGKEL